MVAKESRFVVQRLRGIRPLGSRVYEDEVVALRKNGVEILPLSGSPVVDTMPLHIVEATTEAARRPISSPSRGLPELREALAEMVAREIGSEVDPKREVLITNGSMQALYVIMTALLDPGDEIIIPSPSFFYHPMAHLLGGKPVLVPMAEEDRGYSLDIDGIESHITPRTKAFLLITPHNPTGYVAPRSDLERIRAIAEEHDLIAVSDESYERLVYDGRRQESIASLPGIRKRTVIVRSFTKTFAMGEWRMGYIVASEPLINAFLKVLQYMNIRCNYICQRAAWAAVTGPQDWLAGITMEFEANRNLLYEAILDMEGIFSYKPQGGSFAWIDISGLSASAEAFCDDLLHSFGILGTAGSYFNGPNYVRIPFGGKPDAIEKLKERLAVAVDKHRRR